MNCPVMIHEHHYSNQRPYGCVWVYGQRIGKRIVALFSQDKPPSCHEWFCGFHPTQLAEVLVPAAHVSWEGLKMLGRALSVAAEQTYGYLLQPLGGCGYFWAGPWGQQKNGHPQSSHAFLGVTFDHGMSIAGILFRTVLGLESCRVRVQQPPALWFLAPWEL